MQLADFGFDLPRDLIADRPAEPRDSARLLVIPAAGELSDRHIADLPELLGPGDLLLADRYYCSYWEFAAAGDRGADVVMRLHQRRQADFRRGRRLGHDDHVVQIAFNGSGDLLASTSYDSTVRLWDVPSRRPLFRAMAAAESRRPDGIDVVAIVTPNQLHLPVAAAFLDAGIHVICDKPMTFSLTEAKQLVVLVECSKLIFALTHNYTGYPAVRHARHLVRSNAIGEIRKVLVEYLQDWLMEPLEKTGSKQAAWRTDPTRSGIAGSIGDIQKWLSSNRCGGQGGE